MFIVYHHSSDRVTFAINLLYQSPDPLQLSDVLGMDTSRVILTSAKTGKGLGDVLPAVIE